MSLLVPRMLDIWLETPNKKRACVYVCLRATANLIHTIWKISYLCRFEDTNYPSLWSLLFESLNSWRWRQQKAMFWILSLCIITFLWQANLTNQTRSLDTGCRAVVCLHSYSPGLSSSGIPYAKVRHHHHWMPSHLISVSFSQLNLVASISYNLLRDPNFIYFNLVSFSQIGFLTWILHSVPPNTNLINFNLVSSLSTNIHFIKYSIFHWILTWVTSIKFRLHSLDLRHSEKTCPSATLSITIPKWPDLG
jgi:hypothetical protein